MSPSLSKIHTTIIIIINFIIIYGTQLISSLKKLSIKQALQKFSEAAQLKDVSIPVMSVPVHITNIQQSYTWYLYL